MKPFTQTLLLALVFHTADAAPLGNKKPENATHREILKGIFQKQSNLAFKTTALQKRLIASSYTSNGQIQDSNHYYYTYGKGSTHTDLESYYDNFYALGINTTTKNIMSDTNSSWRYYNGSLNKTHDDVYTYDANNRVINHIYLATAYNLQHSIVYNSTGTIAQVTSSDSFVNNTFIPEATMYMTYDAQNKRMADSTFDLIKNKSEFKRTYTYNAAGNIASFTSYRFQNNNWEQTYETIYSYDTSDRLVLSHIRYTLGSTLYQTKDSFAYMGANTQPYYEVEINWDNGLAQWVPYDAYTYQYNTAGLVDTYYIHQYTTQWDTVERDIMIHDTNGLLQRVNGYLYNGNGNFAAIPYDQTTMYYQEYDPLTIPKQNNKPLLTLYPNPANNLLFVQTSILNGNINITNIKGQTIHSEQLIDQRQTVNTQQLPAGNYILTIFNKDKTQTTYQQFIKQ